MGVTSNWCHPQGHHARRPPTTVPFSLKKFMSLAKNWYKVWVVFQFEPLHQSSPLHALHHCFSLLYEYSWCLWNTTLYKSVASTGSIESIQHLYHDTIVQRVRSLHPWWEYMLFRWNYIWETDKPTIRTSFCIYKFPEGPCSTPFFRHNSGVCCRYRYSSFKFIGGGVGLYI